MASNGTTAAEVLVKHYGGRQETADALDVTRETIRLWLRDGIPLERAIDIERASKGLVTAERILREAKRAETGAHEPSR